MAKTDCNRVVVEVEFIGAFGKPAGGPYYYFCHEPVRENDFCVVVSPTGPAIVQVMSVHLGGVIGCRCSKSIHQVLGSWCPGESLKSAEERRREIQACREEFDKAIVQLKNAETVYVPHMSRCGHRAASKIFRDAANGYGCDSAQKLIEAFGVTKKAFKNLMKVKAKYGC